MGNNDISGKIVSQRNEKHGNSHHNRKVSTANGVMAKMANENEISIMASASAKNGINHRMAA
jgi:hypothetical protein